MNDAAEDDGAYRTLGGIGESELVVERSRFLGEARPVESEEEAEAHVEEVRDEHYDARHVCYGLRVGHGAQRIDRSNDDGEPPRTGGFPIWQVMDGEDVTDALCLVVRYFGGVELGTGGLTRAYRTAGREAIEAAGIVERYPEDRVDVEVPYEAFDRVEHFVDTTEYVRLVEAEYTDSVALHLAVRRARRGDLAERLAGVLNREIEFD